VSAEVRREVQLEMHTRKSSRSKWLKLLDWLRSPKDRKVVQLLGLGGLKCGQGEGGRKIRAKHQVKVFPGEINHLK
jgi:hypothetical protein